MSERVVIIGAGPAGLTAGYELTKASTPCVVLEKDSVVGGLARTVSYNGFHFDIGGHRFFTKVGAVDRFWREVLPPADFLRRKRLSRIYYNKQYFSYPLNARAMLSLGVWNSFLCGLSYCWAQMFPRKSETTLEDWVTNRFGKRLYETFFKTYTEKVWGIPCNEIAADWAAQRIKGLSLVTAIRNALFQSNTDRNGVIKTLIEEFDYPARGPGMMWEKVAELVEGAGGQVHLNTDVVRINWDASGATSVDVIRGGVSERLPGTDFISTMPVRELIAKLHPAPPEEVRRAADALNYRDFLTVAIIVRQPEPFSDNWIYIHDPDVRVGRIQNFKNWSPHMVPNDTHTCLGLEYFCFEGDGLWTMPDADLVVLAKKELAQLGLVPEEAMEDGVVVRMPKAYPVYDGGYKAALNTVRGFIARLPNLQLVGRNGMHKYNNQDHSILTAMLAVENIFGARHDLWAVNADTEYHEEVAESDRAQELRLLAATQPHVPVRRTPHLGRT